MAEPTGSIIRMPKVINSMGVSTIAAPSQQAVTTAIDGVMKTVDGVMETVDGVMETVDGVMETVDGVMETVDATFQPKGDYATNTELNNKLDKSAVVQATGQSTTDVMSQKAVTDLIGSESIGVGQKWVDVTSQRGKEVSYTNSTGKPILIVIGFSLNSSSNGAISVTVDGCKSIMWVGCCSLIVPAGSVYSFAYGPNAQYKSFMELR